MLKNAVIRKAHFVVMLVYSGKIGKSMPYTFGRLADADVLITDEQPSEDLKAACDVVGVELIVNSEKNSL